MSVKWLFGCLRVEARMRKDTKGRGVDSAVMEDLEGRRLLSVGIAWVGWSLASDGAGLVVTAGRTAKVNVVGGGDRFAGQFVVKSSAGTRMVGGVGAGLLPAGSERRARLQIAERLSDGRLRGTMSIDGLGLMGSDGAFKATGRIKGDRLTLDLADQGAGIGKLDARISKNGRVISGKLMLRVYGDVNRGVVSLALERKSDVETVLGFRPVGDSSAVEGGCGLIWK